MVAFFSLIMLLAAPAQMTRNEIINLAVSGVDYSYWWGHGCWRSDGAQLGSCSGGCPDCTHSGSYGADCSGYAAKVWQVPSPSPIENDAHPYSTREFRYNTTHWNPVAREEALRGDCFVYRNSSNTAGHIVVYESGDPWGNIWAYEARGCSYGIVFNLRSLSSSYIAIRRVNVDGSATDGTIKGVVFVDYGQGTADMSERIPGARVTCGDAGETTARADDAYWSFSVPAGMYTLTASADGFESASRDCESVSGGETWCSIGLPPACAKDCTGRVCGPDPLCGLSCGDCPEGQDCSLAGTCEPADCVRQCGDLECGLDPLCDKTCGRCPPGEYCNINGRCIMQGTTCQPDCTGRDCGRDPVCGTSCGTCPPDQACAAGSCGAIDPSLGKLYGFVVALDPNDPDPDPTTAPAVGGALIRSGADISTKAFADGYYELLVPPGEHTLMARAPGYLEGTATCSVDAGGHAECILPVYEELEADVVKGGCGCGASTGALGLPALLVLLLLIRRLRHFALVILIVVVSGCQSEGSYSIHLVFPSEEARSETAKIGLWAANPQDNACPQFQSGDIDAADLAPFSHLEAAFPSEEKHTLERIPEGMVLFLAEGSNAAEARILRGCEEVDVKAGADVEVTILLDWFCRPTSDVDIPRNGIDDDCDGLTDECARDADCEDGDGCTANFCVTEVCQVRALPEGFACNDGDACTSDDHCVAGSCTGTARDCSHLNGVCVQGVCDPGSGMCSIIPVTDGAGCDDGRDCTQNDACTSGVCAGTLNTCDDSDDCTVDSCEESTGACQNERQTIPGAEGHGVSGSCSNLQDDDCDGLTDADDPNCGECTQSEECDDANPCTLDECDLGSCTNTALADGTPCPDALFCTVSEMCSAGVCTTAPRDCSGLSDGCNTGSCSEASDQCLAQPRPDGTACNDGLYCTVADACSGGACSGSANNCDDGNACTRDTCQEDQDRCDHALQPNPGAEGPPGDDTCQNNLDDDCDGRTDLDDGNCAGCSGPADCDDANLCTADACESGACANTPVQDGTSCDDDNACTSQEECRSGSCTTVTFLNCDDDNPCTDDGCDPASGCTNVANTAPCSDGSVCTVGDACSNSNCQPGPPLDCGDGNPCTDDSCDPATGCSNPPNTDPCDDQNNCTQNDQCSGGVCAGTLIDGDSDGHPPLSCGGTDCDDANPDVNPLAAEGPAGDPSCTDSVDNDCDSLTDAADSSCLASTGICNAAGWCWQNPLPQGNTLYDVWAATPDDVWAVGDGGTILHFNGANWSRVESGVTDMLRGVWGFSPTDIYAVGWGGTILHYSGGAWTPQDSGTTQPLHAVWGGSAGDVWVVGHYGTMLRNQGGGWISYDADTGEILQDIWGTGAGDIWAVGYTSAVTHFNGTSWNSVNVGGAKNNLADVWGDAPDNYFAVGASGTILHWDGSRWSGESSGTSNFLHCVYGLASNDLWAFGANNTLLHYDGSQWTAGTHQNRGVQALSGVAADDLWGVGGYGEMLRYDGGQWTSQTRGYDTDLRAVWGFAPDDVWAAGWSGTILHYNGAEWTEANNPTITTLYDLWGPAPGDVWAVGSSGTILHYTNGQWVQVSSGTFYTLNGVGGSAADDVWAVGGPGITAEILRYQGSSWFPFLNSLPRSPNAVWAHSPSDAWLVGPSGTLAHFNGTSWVESADFGTNFMYDVFGFGPDDVWACGMEARVYHLSGGVWTAHDTGASTFLTSFYGIAGSSSDDVWVAGTNGIVYHFDGAGWTDVLPGTKLHLQEVWVHPTGGVWVVGSGGAILHHP